ncbi:hypothetical protein [Lysinibacillus sphaericus]|uniref:hypothetical protein n=1 Tax=Lysinibacillus sphaericus TaxID=1421 RepID=UPI001F3DF183|nr:hypothetical protein [Lysinibacillus sphaericus]
MPTETANYGFTKDSEDEFYNVNVVNTNLDKIDTEMKRIENTIPTVNPTDSVKWLGTVAGTANALTVTHAAITSYSDGLGVSFAANANSSAAATLNINSLGAIPIKKANGTAVTNLKAGGVYTVRYRAGAFILQGEGGSGNAQPNDVLTGKTFTNDSGEFVGTAKKSGLRIKNYQSGVAVIEVFNLKTSIPISPVVSGSTIIKVSYSPNSPSAYSAHVLGYLSGNSVVELVRNGQYNSVDSNLIFWEAIEFDSTVNVIQGVTTINTGSNYSVSTSPFNYSNSQLFYSYNGSSTEGLKSLIGGFRSAGGNEIHFFSRNDLTSTGKFMQIQYYVVDYS